MRLFIAFDLSREIHECLADFLAKQKALFPDIRFVRPEGLHITLKFLGESAVAQLEALESALSQIHHSSFLLMIADLGFFPYAKRPRIFWAGISTHADAVLLAAKVDHACTLVGFAPEKHAWRPHITLARIGSGNPHQHGDQQKSLSLNLPKEGHHEFGMMMVTEFHIYESTLHPQGSIYNKIASFPLKP